MPEPDYATDPSYVPVVRPMNTGGPSSADVSVLNSTDPAHRHPHLFTYDEMVATIRRSLGGELWRLEGMNPSAVQDQIDTALMEYSARVPRLWWEIVGPGVTSYTPKAKAVMGVVRLDFINPISSSGGYAAAYQWNNNLTGVGLVPNAGPGLLMPAGDLMRWVMARKAFLRVASLKPQYHWDPSANLLHIYNPINANYVFVLLTLSRSWAEISNNHRRWFRDHVLALCRYQLAENREKFDGNIQSPGGGMIQTNSAQLMARAEKALEDSRTALYGFQTRVVPIWGD